MAVSFDAQFTGIDESLYFCPPPFKYEIIKLFLETNNLIIFEEFDCHNKEGSYLTSNLLKQTQFSQ